MPVVTWVLLVVAVLVVATGAVLIDRGLQVVPRAAPLPAAPFSVQPGQLTGSAGASATAAQAGGIGAGEPRATGRAKVGSVGGVVGAATDGSGGSDVPSNGTSVPRPQQPAGPVAADHLVVPALGIDAPVTAENVIDGALTIPGDVSTVGVWTGSAGMTAASGTVLLAGHIDNINQGPGALHNLYLLQPGDRVFVQLHGVSSTWQIVTLESYPKSEIPQDLFDGLQGPRRLALVTCGGQIHNGEYDQNVVATAIPA